MERESDKENKPERRKKVSTRENSKTSLDYSSVRNDGSAVQYQLGKPSSSASRINPNLNIECSRMPALDNQKKKSILVFNRRVIPCLITSQLVFVPITETLDQRLPGVQNTPIQIFEEAYIIRRNPVQFKYLPPMIEGIVKVEPISSTDEYGTFSRDIALCEIPPIIKQEPEDDIDESSSLPIQHDQPDPLDSHKDDNLHIFSEKENHLFPIEDLIAASSDEVLESEPLFREDNICGFVKVKDLVITEPSLRDYNETTSPFLSGNTNETMKTDEMDTISESNLMENHIPSPDDENLNNNPVEFLQAAPEPIHDFDISEANSSNKSFMTDYMNTFPISDPVEKPIPSSEKMNDVTFSSKRNRCEAVKSTKQVGRYKKKLCTDPSNSETSSSREPQYYSDGENEEVPSCKESVKPCIKIEPASDDERVYVNPKKSAEYFETTAAIKTEPSEVSKQSASKAKPTKKRGRPRKRSKNFSTRRGQFKIKKNCRKVILDYINNDSEKIEKDTIATIASYCDPLLVPDNSEVKREISLSQMKSCFVLLERLYFLDSYVQSKEDEEKIVASKYDDKRGRISLSRMKSCFVLLERFDYLGKDPDMECEPIERNYHEASPVMEDLETCQLDDVATEFDNQAGFNENISNSTEASQFNEENTECINENDPDPIKQHLDTPVDQYDDKLEGVSLSPIKSNGIEQLDYLKKVPLTECEPIERNHEANPVMEDLETCQLDDVATEFDNQAGFNENISNSTEASQFNEENTECINENDPDPIKQHLYNPVDVVCGYDVWMCGYDDKLEGVSLSPINHHEANPVMEDLETCQLDDVAPEFDNQAAFNKNFSNSTEASQFNEENMECDNQDKTEDEHRYFDSIESMCFEEVQVNYEMAEPEFFHIDQDSDQEHFISPDIALLNKEIYNREEKSKLMKNPCDSSNDKRYNDEIRNHEEQLQSPDIAKQNNEININKDEVDLMEDPSGSSYLNMEKCDEVLTKQKDHNGSTTVIKKGPEECCSGRKGENTSIKMSIKRDQIRSKRPYRREAISKAANSDEPPYKILKLGRLSKGTMLEVLRSDNKWCNAEIIDVDISGEKSEYYVHFEGCNRRMDEWVDEDRFNLSSTKKVTLGIRNSNIPSNLKVTRSYKRKHEETNHGQGSSEDMDAATAVLEKEREKLTNVKYVGKIVFDGYEISTWYFSPFPDEYGKKSKLYICVFCLKYMSAGGTYLSHSSTCKRKRPPGREIYRKDKLSVFEVNGALQKVYCQNLCLLSKLFLDHKNLFFDVEPFNFYILTANDRNGAHFVGYFSKEKESPEQNNLACIMTLPPLQRRGFGRFLIAFSYELSKIEGVEGTPEKPISDLGLRGYKSYWIYELLKILSVTPNLSVKDLSSQTKIMGTDILTVLQPLNILMYWRGDYIVSTTAKRIRELLNSDVCRKPQQTVDPECIHWSPPPKPHPSTKSKK